MTRIKIAALGLVVAALVAAPAFGSSAAASPQPQATKVAYAAIPAGEYRIDAAHSVVGFAIRHLEINWVQGRFRDVAGTIRFDDTDVTKSSVEFTAKVESIDTGVAKRDDHLRTADFFEVAKYPELTFKSTSVKRTGEGQYVVAGDFTLKGVTKRIEFPFTMTGAITDPWGNMRFGVDAKTTIDRRDYGITWGKALAAGGVDVGNEVSIHLALEAVKPKPKPAGQ
jgi:polyisoprenoid-binding protein YceI